MFCVTLIRGVQLAKKWFGLVFSSVCKKLHFWVFGFGFTKYNAFVFFGLFFALCAFSVYLYQLYWVLSSLFWFMPLQYHARNDILPCWTGPTNCQPQWLRNARHKEKYFDCWSYHIERWIVMRVWKTVPKCWSWFSENQTAKTEFSVFEFSGQFGLVQLLENWHATFSAHPWLQYFAALIRCVVPESNVSVNWSV